MSEPLKFEKLVVWQKALDFTQRVHGLTRKFPKEEQFILTSQIKRAADSIALNIAEGSTGQTNAEFRLFLGYAVRSAIEVIACLHIGRKRGLLGDDVHSALCEELKSIIKMIHGLRKSLN